MAIAAQLNNPGMLARTTVGTWPRNITEDRKEKHSALHRWLRLLVARKVVAKPCSQSQGERRINGALPNSTNLKPMAFGLEQLFEYNIDSGMHLLARTIKCWLNKHDTEKNIHIAKTNYI